MYATCTYSIWHYKEWQTLISSVVPDAALYYIMIRVPVEYIDENYEYITNCITNTYIDVY